MARYTGPKHKLARREGINILQKVSPSLERRINVIPGSHGKRNRRKSSEYGIQLREKQKLKRIYGLLEKQFKKYVEMASKSRGNTEGALIEFLETRLDNVVYRLGFAKSRTQARQFVSHRHVVVNGKKVNIPSYRVKSGDKIGLSEALLKSDDLKGYIETRGDLPEFVKAKGIEGELIRPPKAEEIGNPVDYQLVIEFYSR